MGNKQATGVEELVRRAQSDMPTREHRYVYNESSPANTARFVARPNRKAVGRKVSTFYIIALLFGFGVAIIAYINNIIVVNRLAAEISQMQFQYDKVLNDNAVLRADINRKSGWERIGKIAGEQIGLRYVKEQPTLFGVEEDLLEKANKKPRQ
jgi:hypothetical protein